jgi:Na+-driven multidrug efflux pump
VSVAVPFGLVSPWLIPFLYGTEFFSSVLPLVLLLGGVLGFGVMMIVNNYIVGQMQRPGLLSIISWLQLAVSIPLYLALISWQGIVGAAIASTATYLIAMACTLYVFLRDSRLSIFFVLVPQPDDFKHFARLLRLVWDRLPFFHKVAHPS